MFVNFLKFCKFCKLKILRFFSRIKAGPLFFQIFIVNAAISIVTISFVSIIILSTNLERTKNILISNCENMANSLAENYIIYDALVSKMATTKLISYLDNIVKNSSTIDSITIIDTRRICLYHYAGIPEETEIPILPLNNKKIQTQIIEIGKDRKGRPVKQLCSFVSIKTESGVIYGYAIVGISLQTLHRLNQSYILRYFLIVLATIFTTISTSYFIFSKIRKSLMGYEPESFAKLFSRKTKILDNLEEGLISIDLAGNITVCTESAKKLFNLKKNENYEGRSLKELNICMNLISVLESGIAEHNIPQSAGKNSLIINFVPLKEYDNVIGAVAIIRNHTTLKNMAEELTGFRFVVEALRSNMHNFKNEMHILLGMLQLEEYQLAMDYITHFNSLQTSQNAVIKNIQNKTIAALILGKTNEAKEQGIDLLLEKSSFLERHNSYLSTSQLTVILGNLLENSIEATKSAKMAGEIKLFINSDDSCLRINVDDNGCGVPAEIQDRIFERGFSTKTEKKENHGIGLDSVNTIIKNCKGIIEIDSAGGEGTSISIRINQKRWVSSPENIAGEKEQ